MRYNNTEIFKKGEIGMSVFDIDIVKDLHFFHIVSNEKPMQSQHIVHSHTFCELYFLSAVNVVLSWKTAFTNREKAQ